MIRFPSAPQIEAERIQQQIDQMSQVPGLGKRLVQYQGGVSIYYVSSHLSTRDDEPGGQAGQGSGGRCLQPAFTPSDLWPGPHAAAPPRCARCAGERHLPRQPV